MTATIDRPRMSYTELATPPVPDQLRAIAEANPDVWLLGDLDALSHTGEAACGRRTDGEVAHDLFWSVQAAGRLGNLINHRYASSADTALTHLPLVLSQPNNAWVIRRGVDGADSVIQDELDRLIRNQAKARRPRAIVLIGADHCYADQVRTLRRLGVATWLLYPHAAFLSYHLARAATAVTEL